MAYIPHTPDDVRVMLDTIGLDSLDQLFDMIPPEFRLNRPLAVPPALGELELTNHVGALLATNVGGDVRPCFLGGGAYDHFIPSVVDNLAARGEFYTAYTPYQPEASQGTLQATFEYQTLITQLTGMDVSNASLYDGGSAVAEAVLMALTITRRLGRVVVAGAVHPETARSSRRSSTISNPTSSPSPARRRHRSRGSRRRDHRRHRRRRDPTSEFLRPARRDRSAGRARPSERRARGRERRPDQPGNAPPTGRLRRRHRGRRRAISRQSPRLRRSVSRHHGLSRGVRPQDAGANRRRNDRPQRQALLGVDLANARAAYPTRKSDVQHLHQSRVVSPSREHLSGRCRPFGLATSRRTVHS